ncbi:gasdermin-B [Vulpes vulpes]|uniref:Gasdermin-B n=1 Tax=Vulpes vulpes TaxID=9627 RepID=A0ABM4ZDQ6_VULVU
MSSIFEEITRVVVQEMDAGGDRIAVRSILHADRFHCCSLVRGRRNFWGHQYHRTDLILEDILERGEGEELFEKLDSGPQASETLNLKQELADGEGEMSLAGGAPGILSSAPDPNPHSLQEAEEKTTYFVAINLENESRPVTETLEMDLTEEEQKHVLSCLIKCLNKDGFFFNAAEFLVKTHIESILDILDNLIEVSEEQCLMAEAPEKGTLPLLKDQVESVLEQNCSEQPQAVGCDPDV